MGPKKGVTKNGGTEEKKPKKKANGKKLSKKQYKKTHKLGQIRKSSEMQKHVLKKGLNFFFLKIK